MCGIAGIIGEGAAKHIDAVRHMVEAQRHRGPDGEGIYISPSGFCVLGHRRLAIMDLSDAAVQPMLADEGKVAFVYNGMCYNFREMRDELHRHENVKFTTTGDTEVVLQLLVHDGIRALVRLNAMFALALWDENKRQLLLARDRFGQKPLYITRVGKLTIFASEINALLASGLVPRKADSKGICGYFSYGSIQEPGTIIAGVSTFPRASYAILDIDGEETRRQYWFPSLDKRYCSSGELREIFMSAVARHLISDAPIGLFLSGGIDSSSIAAAAVHSSKESVKALSIVFPDQPEQSESKYAQRIAKYAGVDHHEIPILGKDILHLLPSALKAMDQPTVNGINTFIISHAAHQAGLKVALSGLGGDELFGGYPSFRDVPRIVRLRNILGALSNPVADLLDKLILPNKNTSKFVDMLDAPGNLVELYLVRRRIFSSRQIKALAPGLEKDGWISGLSSERLNELEEMIETREIYDAIGLMEIDIYMAQTLLRDSDFMSMVHGLEVRMPFLDTEFANCALALDSIARKPSRKPKHFFVKAMDNWLPKEIKSRTKHGFSMPFQEWMLNELHGEVEEGIEVLTNSCGYLNGEAIRTVWESFCNKPLKIGWGRPWLLFVLGRYLLNNNLNL